MPHHARAAGWTSEGRRMWFHRCDQCRRRRLVGWYYEVYPPIGSEGDAAGWWWACTDCLVSLVSGQPVAAKNDMYGRPIWLLGDTGYGVSVSVYTQGEGPPTPDFAFFHRSDGFRQALFSVTARGTFPENRAPEVHNVFQQRVDEVLAVATARATEAAGEG